MKFLHLGDLHIGKSLAEFDLIDDQKYILNQIVDIAVKERVDAILLAGDIYDKSIPSEAAVRLFDYFICNLAEAKIKVFVISGNHDSDERLNFGSLLFENSDVYISSKYKGCLYKQELEDEYGKTNVYLMPFVKASQVKYFYPDKEINNYDDAIRTVLENNNVNYDERNVLVAHQFVVSGGAEPILSGSESMGTVNVGLVEKINSENFSKFDYVALGHIHSPQTIGYENIRYAGSPLKYSRSEVNSDKYATIIEIKEKGNIEITLKKLFPVRDMRHIKGKLCQLLSEDNITSPDDYIYATLTDEDVIDDAMGKMQQYYPHTIRIEYENSHTKEIQNIETVKNADNKSFDELFNEFYRLMYGCDMNEDEKKLISSIAREVGVDNETY